MGYSHLGNYMLIPHLGGVVPPEAPTDLQITGASGGIVNTLTPEATADVTAGAVTYDFELALTSVGLTGEATVTGQATPAYTFSTLLNFTSYTIAIRARNAAGPGPWSATVTVQTAVYLVNEQFGTDYGVLTENDPTGVLAVSGGEVVPSGAVVGVNNPGVYLNAGHARVAGRAFKVRAKRVSAYGTDAAKLFSPSIAWTKAAGSTSIAQYYGFIFSPSVLAMLLGQGTATVNVLDADVSDTYYDFGLVLMATGMVCLVNGKVAFAIRRGTDATLYPTVAGISSNRHPQGLDDFITADLGGAWAEATSIATTWLSGAQSAGQTFTHAANVMPLEFTVTLPSAGNVQVTFRKQDATNYWMMQVDSSGNFTLIEVVAGLPTTRATIASCQTGDRLCALALDTSIKLIRDRAVAEVVSNTYASATNFATETDGEILSLGTGGGVSDLIAWPRDPSAAAMLLYNRADVPPVAGFSASATTGYVLLPIDFTDESTKSPTVWLWDFGDGNISTEQNPTHEYAEVGTYTVSLTVTNAAGSDTEVKTDYIEVQLFPLNAEFTTDESAPLTTPNTAEPGPGSLAVTDVAGTKVAKAYGELSITGNNAVDAEGVVSDDPMTRAPGLTFMAKVRIPYTSNSGTSSLGMANSKALPYAHGDIVGRLGGGSVYFGTQTVHTLALSPSIFNFFFIARAVGHFLVVTDGLNWYMPYVGNLGSGANLYPGVEMYHATYTHYFDDLRVLQSAAWDDDADIYTDIAASPSAGAVITTEADAVIELTWTPATSEVLDIQIRRTDDDNCWIVRCDEAGNRIYLYKKETGTETELGATGGIAQTFNVGTAYRICVSAFDATIRTFVTNSAKHAYTSATFQQTSTGAKATGFTTASNFIAWPYDLTGSALATDLMQHAGDRWSHTRLGNCPIAVEQHGFEELNGLLYVVAGRAAAAHSQKVYAYDPVLDTWTEKADYPIAVQSLCLRAVNGKLYGIGGWNSVLAVDYQDVYEYDPDLDTWTQKTDMPSGREDMGSAVIGTKIYVFGGLINQVMTNVMEVYDTATDTWDETKADLPAGKWSGDFGAAYGGKVYAVGASDSFADYPTSLHPTGTTYEYDPDLDTWTQKTSIPYPSQYREIAALGAYLYAVSGVQNTVIDYNDKIYVYDPALDTWTLDSSSPYQAQGSGLTVYDGAIYMSCGKDDSGKLAYLFRLTL